MKHKQKQTKKKQLFKKTKIKYGPSNSENLVKSLNLLKSSQCVPVRVPWMKIQKVDH